MPRLQMVRMALSSFQREFVPRALLLWAHGVRCILSTNAPSSLKVFLGGATSIGRRKYLYVEHVVSDQTKPSSRVVCEQQLQLLYLR